MAAEGGLTLTWAGTEIVGQAVRFTANVVDATGAPVNAATLTLTISGSDSQTVNIGSWTNTGTGVYTYDYLPPVAGSYLAAAVTTVPNAADEQQFTFTAVPPVRLQDFKNYLNLTKNSGLGGDLELQMMLDAALALADFEIGDILPRTRTEFHHGGRPEIILDHPPITVTTVTETSGTINFTVTEQPLNTSSSGWSAYGFTRDGYALTRRINGFPSAWLDGRFNVCVVYQSGLASVPQNVVVGISQLALHLFQSQGGMGGQRGQTEWAPGPAYAIPMRVRELLRPQHSLPGIG